MHREQEGGKPRLMGKLNSDNRGFSLVEIIVVVSIMSIMIGVIGYGLSLSSGKPAEECAKKLSAAISHGRTATMGKYRNVITVKKEDDGRLTVTEDTYIKIYDDGTTPPDTSRRSSVVGAKNVTVKYKIGTGSYEELTNGSSIELRYDSGSGAMKRTAPGNEYYTGFEISKSGKVWYVKLETLTGKVTASTSET